VSIRERPAEAGDRAVTGHWEGDLLFGSNSSQIATLVERHTRYVLLVSVPSKDTRTVINALIKQANYREDRGKEMADHQRFSLATDIKVYFCDPQHPWQRGSNENTNQRNATMLFTGRDICRMCCGDRLNLQFKSGH
jgi:IS30 family transposase